MPKVFLAGGRTAGPLMPLISIVNNINNHEAFVFDVQNSFGKDWAIKNQNHFVSMPEAKLSILTFKGENFIEIVKNIIISFWQIILLIYSFMKSVVISIKEKPNIVLSAGGFTSVPLIFAIKLTNFFKITNTKTIIHQQDPQPGLSNRLTIKFGDIKSCVFDYTKENYKQFRTCQLIPNPLNTDLFDNKNIYKQAKDLEYINPKLYNFFNSLDGDKKLLFIYGGYSGAEFVNEWVVENLARLLRKFNIIHLTGKLQDKDFDVEDNNQYIVFESLDHEKEIPLVLFSSDVVISRAGLGAITELSYLKKPTFLIPIPNSHQEINAKLSEDMFYRLNQKNSDDWLYTIEKNYPIYFDNIAYKDQKDIKFILQNYYDQINSYLLED